MQALSHDYLILFKLQVAIRFIIMLLQNTKHLTGLWMQRQLVQISAKNMSFLHIRYAHATDANYVHALTCLECKNVLDQSNRMLVRCKYKNINHTYCKFGYTLYGFQGATSYQNPI